MRKSSIAIVTAGLFMAAAPVLAAGDAPDAKGEAALAKALDHRVAGKPVNCINLRTIGTSEIIEGTAILYHADNGTIYVNRPAAGAASLKKDQILKTRTPDTQLCNIDSVDLIDRSSQIGMGFVNLSDFVPYTRASHSN